MELDGPEKFTYVSSLLSNEEREQLRLTLLHNIDLFARRHSDMVGINSMVASHKLNVLPTAKPIRQQVRRSSGSTSDNSDGSRQSSSCWFYKGGKVPRIAGQCGGGTEGGWKVACMCRLH